MIFTRHALATSAAVLLLGLGCSAEQPVGVPAAMSTESQEFRQQAEDIVNRYTAALFARDTAAIESIVSTEIQERIKTYGGGTERFIEKQRGAMLATFRGMNENGLGGGFQVTRVERQEGSALVRLSRDGVALLRPFHFVLEGDQYKLNVHRAGFSKPLAPGAAADNDFVVENHSRNITVGAACEGGGEVSVGPGGSGTVSCPNACGFFEGADFNGTGWFGHHLCDYNTFGPDVIYEFNAPSGAFGMHCFDRCGLPGPL